MKNQVELFKETLENLKKNGRVKMNFGLGRNEEVFPSYPGVAREVGEDLLDIFPKVDSEDVRAYRAARFLIEYLEDNDYDEPNYVDGLTVERQLHRLASQFQEDGMEEVLDRLEVLDDPSPKFQSPMLDGNVVFDPVSKRQSSLTASASRESEMLELHKQHLARNILESGV